jgi:hypothetical protein
MSLTLFCGPVGRRVKMQLVLEKSVPLHTVRETRQVFQHTPCDGHVAAGALEALAVEGHIVRFLAHVEVQVPGTAELECADIASAFLVPTKGVLGGHLSEPVWGEGEVIVYHQTVPFERQVRQANMADRGQTSKGPLHAEVFKHEVLSRNVFQHPDLGRGVTPCDTHGGEGVHAVHGHGVDSL